MDRLGAHRGAVLTGIVARRLLPGDAALPSLTDPQILGSHALAVVEAEAAQLDLDTTCTIALDALDRILEASP